MSAANTGAIHRIVHHGPYGDDIWDDWADDPSDEWD
jgi:hypothetical protein